MLRDSENQLLGLGDEVSHLPTGAHALTVSEIKLKGGCRVVILEGEDGTRIESSTWNILRTKPHPATAKAERLRTLKRTHEQKKWKKN